MDSALLNTLVCPETKQNLKLAPQDLIKQINSAILEGSLRAQNGELVTERIDEGLLQAEAPRTLYPVRGDIPILLAEEAITLDNFQIA